MTPLPSLTWAVISDSGLKRTSNEDSYSTRPDVGLFVVADGMGGHVAGEVASRVAVEAIESFIQETAGADKNRTWPFPFDPTISLEANRLRAAFRLANRKIASAIADSQDLRGMATTASAVLLGPRTASVAHVGDSRVYVLRAGQLEQIAIRSRRRRRQNTTREDAVVALSSIVGALLLSRAVDDAELSEEFLARVREAVVTAR